MKTFMRFFPILFLLFFALFTSGCTALGYSTGSAIDRAIGDKESVIDVQSFCAEDELFLHWNNRPMSVGIVVGVQSSDRVLIEYYSGRYKKEAYLSDLVASGELGRIEKVNAKKTFRSVLGGLGFVLDLSLIILVAVVISRIPGTWEP